MHDISTITNAVISLASIGVIFYLWSVAYPSMRVEEFRQKIFKLRNDLFDKASKGEISFDDKMYAIVRNTMNGVIKDADSITLADMFAKFFLVARHKPNSEYKQIVESALNALPAERREIYQRSMNRLSMEMIAFIGKRGLFVYALVCLFRIFNGVLNVSSRIKKILVPAAEMTECQAYHRGKSNSVIHA